ncbi:MAG: biotin/lipoyl-binding protein [Gammaproteobacteria bacterium PRO9]|nr:biotin/lipoyl-binding protein [Gammaproteobacteria bacterium PRO9]
MGGPEAGRHLDRAQRDPRQDGPQGRDPGTFRRWQHDERHDHPRHEAADGHGLRAAVVKPAVAIACGAATLLAAAGAWWGWTSFATGDQVAAERTFVTPERRNVAATVLATGILRTRVGGEVRVGAQLSGIVEKLNVVVGSRVRKGDVIATIDARPLEARLAQARAQIAVAAQELKRAEVELDRLPDHRHGRLGQHPGGRDSRSQLQHADLRHHHRGWGAGADCDGG